MHRTRSSRPQACNRHGGIEVVVGMKLEVAGAGEEEGGERKSHVLFLDISTTKYGASIPWPLGDPVMSDWRSITYQVRFIFCNKTRGGVRNFEALRIIPMKSLYLELKQNRLRSLCLDLGRHTISGQPLVSNNLGLSSVIRQRATGV